jgi:hypothetical protein
MHLLHTSCVVTYQIVYGVYRYIWWGEIRYVATSSRLKELKFDIRTSEQLSKVNSFGAIAHRTEPSLNLDSTLS